MNLVLGRSALAFLVVLGFASSAFGQANATGRIFGRVDSEAGPLPGVTAVAESPNLQQPFVDNEEMYRLLGDELDNDDSDEEDGGEQIPESQRLHLHRTH